MRRAVVLGVLSLIGVSTLAPGAISAADFPPGFQESSVLEGLVEPTELVFSPDGRVFVAERAGVIKVFQNLDDSSPTVFADLGDTVYSAGVMGIMGLALHPSFPDEPWVYVFYTLDAGPGQVPPIWNDDCPSPPTPTSEGCLASGRLSRLEAFGDVMVGSEQVLLDGWCQQYTSHTVGHLEFGPDGALYISAGEGANWAVLADYGQLPQGCDDPPLEGGALRSQDLQTPADPTGFSGTILRVDPETGEALPDNPLSGGSITDDDRVIAYGLRNPYRFTVHPETGEIWIGDVGDGTYEEIDRIVDPIDDVVENFGWPCYEGPFPHAGFDELDLPICEQLYSQPAEVTAPFWAYHHQKPVGEASCQLGGAVSGIAFYPGGDYPDDYAGALFIADWGRGCIFRMLPGPGGVPDPATVDSFATAAWGVSSLRSGPDGDLFYLYYWTGEVRRIVYVPPPPQFLRADTDGSGSIQLPDGVAILGYLFTSMPAPCLDAFDANDDGSVNLPDCVWILNYLFANGAPPPPPLGQPPGDCGADPTPDSIDCVDPPANCN